MTDLPIARVTDTYFVVYDFNAFTGDFAAHRAIQEWVAKHGIPPDQVSAYGPIHRDEERCRVAYVGRQRGARLRLEEEGGASIWSTCVQQGETPPLPWPAELDRYRVPAS